MDPKKQCAHCGKQLENPLRCSRCQVAVYCCREHQRADWKTTHKLECKPKGAAVIHLPPTTTGASDPTAASFSSGDGGSTRTAPTTPTLSSSIQQTAVQSSPSSRDSGASSGAGKAKTKTKEDRDKGEDIDEILAEHDKFEKTFNALRAEHGLTLAAMPAAFDLMNSWIGLYKLEPTDALIAEVAPVCEKLGGDWHIKAIQCRAFLRYKQHRFKEALADFLEFRRIAGNSAELAENTGHTYNTLGDYQKAEECFVESLRLMDLPGAPAKSSSNKGGVLLGLGLVKERLGQTEEGLAILLKALEFYKNRFQGVEHSLIAKTLMSVGHAQEKLARFPDAIHSYREATRIFKYTCGDDTPLTANAVLSLAKCLHKHDPGEEAHKLLQEALRLYVEFDTLHVYMVNIIEILTEAKTWAMQEKKNPPEPGPAALAALHNQFLPLLPTVMKCEKRLKEEKKVDVGSAAVFNKTGGEICMLSGAYDLAVPLIQRAVSLFETITEVNCQGLVQECRSMLTFMGHGKKDKDSA